MYNAYGTMQDDTHHGSTRLHMDLTDAVNIMLWAAPLPDGKPGCALWHIFPAEASSSLRTFMRNDLSFDQPGDPIHSQSIYLTPGMLDTLATKYNVRPFTILQHSGEAVFIPAGCAHQVSYHLTRENSNELTLHGRSATSQMQSKSLAIIFQLRMSSGRNDLLASFVNNVWPSKVMMFSNYMLRCGTHGCHYHAQCSMSPLYNFIHRRPLKWTS
jgi:hypothetical protein